jgi:hypothetical protein
MNLLNSDTTVYEFRSSRGQYCKEMWKMSFETDQQLQNYSPISNYFLFIFIDYHIPRISGNLRMTVYCKKLTSVLLMKR